MIITKKYLYYLSRIILKPLVPPELLIISLTQICNLKCRICNIREELIKENLHVDIEKITDILNQAKKMGIFNIVLSGGEPFLADEIFELIKYARGLGLSVTITTNGFYNDKLVERIANSNIDHLHFSFDGLKECHDEIRGKGTYDRLMQTVSLIRRLNPHQSLGFGTVVSNRNCNDLFEMTKIADEIKVNSMNFIPYLINNTDPQHSKKGRKYSELWPGEEDLVYLKSNLEKISYHHYVYIKIDRNPDFETLLNYYSLRKIQKKCFAGYKSMIVTAAKNENGSPVSNVFFCQDSCGNIYTTSIKKAWHSAKAWKMRLIAKRCTNSCAQFCHYI